MAPSPTTLSKMIDLRERAMRLGHATAYNHFDRRIAALYAEQVAA